MRGDELNWKSFVSFSFFETLLVLLLCRKKYSNDYALFLFLYFQDEIIVCMIAGLRIDMKWWMIVLCKQLNLTLNISIAAGLCCFSKVLLLFHAEALDSS